jgi:polar amino acid transport system permease protein
MRQAETVAGQSYRPIEVFTTVMVIYFLLIFPVTRLIDRYYMRVAHLGRS